MKSMTGFGRSTNRLSKGDSPKKARASKSSRPAALAGEQSSALAGEQLNVLAGELDISLKSVNGRYLEIRFHLPREYAALENEFKSIIASVMTRGTVDVYVNRSRSNRGAEIKVDTALARHWLESYRKLGRELKVKGEPDLEMLSRIPEIFEVDHHSDLNESEIKLAKRLLEEAVEACDRERSREGQALENELSGLCARLEKLAEQADALKTEAQTELERRLRDRLQENLTKRGFEGRVDDQRVAQEVVMYLDRADISEELTRLREHLKAYRQLLKNKDPQGKKLDFYAQELLREVNAIGSKSHITKLTSLVVEAKTVVEKIREQVQNVE